MKEDDKLSRSDAKKSAEDKQLHAGHRSRLRERFLKHGLEGFEDHQALELLLSYALPRRDTNALAHQILNHCGGFRQVFESDISELSEIKGLKENSAGLIALVAALNRRYLKYLHQETMNRRKLESTEECCAYCSGLFHYTNREELWMICVNAQKEVLSEQMLAFGSPDMVKLPVREVVEIAIRSKALGVILAHNHPGGIALPSAQDLYSTRQLAQALRLVDIQLMDHIIVTDTDCVSMRASSMLYKDTGNV